MRIEKLYLKEVGPFDELWLDFPAPTTPGKADITILTGPNGCGKSTILYAIASLLSAPPMGIGPLGPRLRGPTSECSLQTTRGPVVLIPTGPAPSSPWWPVRDGQIFHFGERRRVASPDIDAWHRAVGDFDPASDSGTTFDYAAFGQSGQRALERYLFGAIDEPKHSPFFEALSFDHAEGAQLLGQWLVIQRAKEAMAAQAGDLTLAARYAQALSTIERVVGLMIKEDLRFVFSIEPLALSVQLGSRRVRLDLLPAGVKSVVTWVGDVLMRLDRIPWVGDTPILERPFLLLLDEIDIHLHPRWQRNVLPIVQELFPRAQVIVSTHSPFVVGSVAGATVHAFDVKDGVATLRTTTTSTAGSSYLHTLRTIFQVDTEFDVETERKLDAFEALKTRVLKGEAPFTELEREALELAKVGTEVHDIVALEVRQTQRQLAATAKP